MKRTNRLVTLLLCAGVALMTAACGGGDDGSGGGNASGSGGSPTGGGASCSAVKPQCTVSASPASTANSPLPAGTNVVLSASCSTGVTQADWFTNAQTFAKGLNVTVNPSTTTGYGFAYSNCAGGDHAGLYVYVGSGSNGGTPGNGGGNNGGGSSGSGGSVSTNSGTSAVNCLRTGTNAQGSITVTNTCNAKIQTAYCTLYAAAQSSAAGALFVCKGQPASFSPTGYVYEQAAGSMNPGQTDVLLGTAVQNQKAWVMACVTGIPHIVDFNTPTINANSTATGICY
ncbi:hypothetical protein HGR00_01060 [Ralstonia insidiosa]|uniref:Ig-like domain-containing protein n=2 Tax=Ralstonia insidiosa TaxID=190721 RepID=A0A848NTW2_9RALS|nr:hypothetical protein [Ralstonia insidiosa]